MIYQKKPIKNHFRLDLLGFLIVNIAFKVLKKSPNTNFRISLKVKGNINNQKS